MIHSANIDQDWIPLCKDIQLEIPTDHPIVRLVHKQPAQHTDFDIKLGRFISHQDVFDAMSRQVRQHY